MTIKMHYETWKNLPEWQKDQNLFERCEELEKKVDAQEKLIHELSDRLKQLEERPKSAR